MPEVMPRWGLLCVSFLFLAMGSGACGTSRPAAEADEVKSTEPSPSKASKELRACLATLRGPGTRSELAASAVGTCSALWKQESCSNAWKTSLDHSAFQRPTLIMNACRDAYCPDLPQGVALCDEPKRDVDLLDESTPWMPMWESFNARVLGQELQLEENVDLAAFARSLLLLVTLAPSPPSPPSPPP